MWWFGLTSRGGSAGDKWFASDCQRTQDRTIRGPRKSGAKGKPRGPSSACICCLVVTHGCAKNRELTFVDLKLHELVLASRERHLHSASSLSLSNKANPTRQKPLRTTVEATSTRNSKPHCPTRYPRRQLVRPPQQLLHTRHVPSSQRLPHPRGRDLAVTGLAAGGGTVRPAVADAAHNSHGQATCLP
jgi:hypothetical protein